MTYNEFIQNIIDTRGQWNIQDGEYWEGHHIIPVCKGGSGNTRKKDKNIIWLYPREHYEAHRLLAMENPFDWDLVNAFHCISHMCASTNERFVDKLEYEEARKMMSTCIKASYPYTIECVETGELFKCPSDVKEKYPRIHSNHVGQCCRGERITTGGYHFRFFNCNDFKVKSDKLKKLDIGPIRCIETGIVYDRVGDISESYHKCLRIIECCKGNCITVDKLHWEFVDMSIKVPVKDDRRKYGRANWSEESKNHYILAQREAHERRKNANPGEYFNSKSRVFSGRHWYNNGSSEVFTFNDSVPDGYVAGRLKQ